MMVKILTQSGNSLADIYDVQGSIAGIDQLHTRELPIVHEMGNTIFSERFSTGFRRSTTGDLLQSVNFDVAIGNLPVDVTRLLGVAVISDNMSRVAQASILVLDPIGGQEIPIWNYDVGNSELVRMVDDGQGAATFDLLTAQAGSVYTPNFVGGTGQLNEDMASSLVLRGRTTAFGAGTVFITSVYHMAAAHGFLAGSGVSSRGLPIPSW